MNKKEALESAIEFFEQADEQSASYWTFTRTTREEIVNGLREALRPEAVLSEAHEALKIALPYLEGMADKLAIASNSPEVIHLHENIVRVRMAIKKTTPQVERSE